MGYVSDIEDYCEEDGFIVAVRTGLRSASEDPKGRGLEIWFEWKEYQQNAKGIDTMRINPKDTNERRLKEAIRARLDDLIEDEPRGTLRLYFRCAGDTKTVYKSFVRTFKPMLEGHDRETSSRILELKKENQRLRNHNHDQTLANVEILKGHGEALDGLSKVVAAMNPMPNQIWQVVGQVAAPAVAALLQGKGKKAAPQPIQKVVPGQILKHSQTGERVTMMADGSWVKETPQGWVPCPPPPGLPQGQGQGQITPPKSDETSAPHAQADPQQLPEGGEQRQLTAEDIERLADEDPMRALGLLKTLAKKNNISPEQVAALLSED